jgi:hypothetical protein
MTGVYVVIVVGLLGLFIVIQAYHHFFPTPLPTFCTKCGCPLEESWYEGDPWYSPQGGDGTRVDRKRLRCVNYYEEKRLYRGYHDIIELSETRTVVVAPQCAKGELNG